MGFDANSFDRLLVKFGPMFSGHMPFDESGMIVEFEYTTGKKRETQPENCLGLVLVWTRTRGLLNLLQIVFGLTNFFIGDYLILRLLTQLIPYWQIKHNFLLEEKKPKPGMRPTNNRPQRN